MGRGPRRAQQDGGEQADSTPGLAARAAALRMLVAVSRARRSLDNAADQAGLDRLPARDRGLAWMIALTALRRAHAIDWVIDHCMSRPLPENAVRIRDILAIGIAQILFMRVPSHAVVDLAVRMASGSARGRFSGLVNAVLRRVSREQQDLLAQVASLGNLPSWMTRAWETAYGVDQTSAIKLAHLSEPPLDLSFPSATDSGDRTLLDSVMAKAARSWLVRGGLRIADGGLVSELPGYQDGRWWVQDFAARLPVRLLGPVADETVLDLCAAPGGKTAQLASAGAKVIAVDWSEQRTETLRENMQRLGLSAQVESADMLTWEPPEQVGHILLDAPCTATGTMRRHPDIAFLKEAADVAAMATLQRQHLTRAARWLQPGGRLVFCTCSLQPEEGPEVIEWFLANHTEFQLCAATEASPDVATEFITHEGYLRTLPHFQPERDVPGGMDGFFAACLTRNPG